VPNRMGDEDPNLTKLKVMSLLGTGKPLDIRESRDSHGQVKKR